MGVCCIPCNALYVIASGKTGSPQDTYTCGAKLLIPPFQGGLCIFKTFGCVRIEKAQRKWYNKDNPTIRGPYGKQNQNF